MIKLSARYNLCTAQVSRSGANLFTAQVKGNKGIDGKA